MPEFRQNPITKEWVIIATERAQRGDAFLKREPRPHAPHYLADCPFCPGNERLAAEESLRLDGSRGWDVRVVANKYSVLSAQGKRSRRSEGLKRMAAGVGIHDVIVETPDHGTSLALLPVTQVEKVVQAYKQRYFAVSDDPRIELITIFKNHGGDAGISQPHPHSQLIATPIISPQVRNRMEEALRHFDQSGECMFCQVLTDEIYDSKRIISENPHFVAFVPFAALSPYHIWIFPRRHQASFGEIRMEEIGSMASILKDSLARVHYGLDDPDYNFVIRTAPSENRYCKYYHWYISIIPRLTKVAGFELGSGFFVNVTSPEDNAERLRQVKIPAAAHV